MRIKKPKGNDCIHIGRFPKRRRAALSNNKSRDPLLYIHQPDLKFPKANMQQTYLVKKEETETQKPEPSSVAETEVENKKQTQPEQERNHKSSSRGQETKAKKGEGNKIAELNFAEEEHIASKDESSKQELNPTVVQDVIDQYHEKDSKEEKAQANKQHSYSFKRVKSFKEMSTTEKLNYLVHFPKLLPPVPCIFITGNRSVKGFLVSKTEDSIEVKQFNEKIIQILIEHLTDVKMIGIQ
jgi:hypothetical protein